MKIKVGLLSLSLLWCCLSHTLNDSYAEIEALECHLKPAFSEQSLQKIAALLTELTQKLEALDHQEAFDKDTTDLITTTVVSILQVYEQTDLVSYDGTEKRNKLITPQSNTPETKQIIMTTFTNIIGNLAAIATSPRNPQVISSNMSCIVANIINMVRQLIAKKQTTPIQQ